MSVYDDKMNQEMLKVVCDLNRLIAEVVKVTGVTILNALTNKSMKDKLDIRGHFNNYDVLSVTGLSMDEAKALLKEKKKIIANGFYDRGGHYILAIKRSDFDKISELEKEIADGTLDVDDFLEEWMAAIGCLPLLADMIPNMIRFRKEHIYELWKTFIINAVLLGCIAVILPEIAGQIENKKIPTKNAAEYLASVAEPDRERVYTSFDNGGMFEWYGFKVYTDARPELFTEEINKKESIDSEIYNVEYGVVNYRDFIDKYDFTYIVVNDDTPFVYYLENDTKWTDVYISDGIRIYTKFP